MEYAGPGSDAYVRATSPENSSGSQHPAADILGVASAPLSPLSMIELPNVDSSAAPAGGAVTAAPGPFRLHAVGLAPSPDAREPLERASAPVDTSGSAVSFAEGRLGDADALLLADRQRLAEMRAELDPDGVIHASRFLRDRDETW